jgi:hypothetical protein
VIRTAGVFKGKLTAGTGDCSQQVETKHAAVRAGDRGTVFDVIVTDEFTSVVVAQGTVEVWSGDNPGDRRRLGPRGETRIPFAAEGGPDKGSEHYCRRYADEAVSQNAENVKRKCGFTGAAWQSDFQAHYGWCSTGDNWRSAAPREDKNRQSQLAACDRSREYCRKYADEAVSQNAENIKRKCGFKGAAWQSSYQVHYGWCTTGDNWRKYAPRESSNRLEQLDACRKRVQLY